MTLLFADSFEGYTAGGDRTVLDPVYGFPGVVATNSAGVVGTGRVSGKCAFIDVGYVQLGDVYGFELDATALSADETWIVGFAFKVDENNFHKSGASRLPLLQFQDSAGDEMVTFFIAGNNVNVVTGGIDSNTKIAIGTATLLSRTWHYVEMKVWFDTAAGVVGVWVDDEYVIGATGVTAPTASAEEFPTKLIFGCSNHSIRVLIDDLYICDSLGGYNNDVLGEMGIRRLSANADGSTSDFTPLGGGANYAEVDEDDPDGDTSYVESSTVGHQDLYGVENLASTPADIRAVQIVVTSKSDDGGAKSGQNYLRSDNKEEDGVAYALTDSYVPHQTIVEEDPKTRDPWVEAGVNAVTVGMEVTA